MEAHWLPDTSQAQQDLACRQWSREKQKQNLLAKPSSCTAQTVSTPANVRDNKNPPDNRAARTTGAQSSFHSQ